MILSNFGSVRLSLMGLYYWLGEFKHHQTIKENKRSKLSALVLLSKTSSLL